MEAGRINAGSLVDRYEVEALLGEGGMARVYKVRHARLHTVHALKVLTVPSASVRHRLVQEGQVQAKLRHPNVVAVTDVIQFQGSPGLVMEFVDGPSLDDLIVARRLTLHEADLIAMGVMAGVAEAHDQQMIHRDLKPANIMLSLEGQQVVPKVADFGLAKLTSADAGVRQARTRTGSTMGTPQYMSPEQIRDAKNVGPATDIFALGAILYELVTGRRAFDGDDLLQIFNKVADGAYVPPHELVPELPDRMAQAIAAALETDAANRPATVQALSAIWRGSAPLPEVLWDDVLVQASALARSRTKSLPPDATNTFAETLAGFTGDDLPEEVPPPSPPEAPSTSSLTERAAVPVMVGGSLLVALGGVGVGLLAVLAAGYLFYTAGPPPPPERQAEQDQFEQDDLDEFPEDGIAAVDEGDAEEERRVPDAPARARPSQAAPPAAEAAPPPELPEEAPQEEPPEQEPNDGAAEAKEEVVLEIVRTPAAGINDLGPEVEDEDPAVRLQAVRTNAHDGSQIATQRLVFLTKDADSKVANAAWEAVADRFAQNTGTYHTQRLVVFNKLRNGTSQERATAIAAMSTGSTSAGDLQAVLTSPDVSNHRAAIDAMVAIAKRRGTQVEVIRMLTPHLEHTEKKTAKHVEAAIKELS